jgi:hypothetical protein
MSALQRFFRMIWRLRITFPLDDILLHADDLDAAFRRVLYHPDMACLFAYIFGKYLIIPVGQCFGSCSAPSYFSLLSDIRQFVATASDIGALYPLHHLAADIQLPDPPLPADLFPAVTDGLNPPLTAEEQAIFHNASFVDDNGVCATADRIHQTLQQSLVSAFVLFGWPDEDRRSSCMAADKWDPNVNFVVLFLGYLING